VLWIEKGSGDIFEKIASASYGKILNTTLFDILLTIPIKNFETQLTEKKLQIKFEILILALSIII